MVPGSKVELDSFPKALLEASSVLALSPPIEEHTLKSTEDMPPLDRICLGGCGSTREANRYPPDPNSLFLLTLGHVPSGVVVSFSPSSSITLISTSALGKVINFIPLEKK